MKTYFLVGSIVIVFNVGCGSPSSSGTGNDAGSNNPVDAGAESVETVHGCSTAAYQNRSAGTREVTFGGAVGLNYSPKCMRISVGQTVTFKGDFGTHPLAGGMYMGTLGTTPNPIMERTTGSVDYTVTFDKAGLYPYYCDFHAPSMAGSIWVK